MASLTVKGLNPAATSRLYDDGLTMNLSNSIGPPPEEELEELDDEELLDGVQ